MGTNQIDNINQNLDENETELTNKERDFLNDIEPADFAATSESLGNSKIQVSGEDIALRDVVLRISRGTINYKDIPTQGQALTQTYLVTRGQKLGSFNGAKRGIDGKIGTQSIQAIKNEAPHIQEDSRYEQQDREIQKLRQELQHSNERNERIAKNDLCDSIQSLRLADLKSVIDQQYQFGYGLFITSSNQLRKVEITNDNKLNISYKSKVTGEYSTITVTPAKFDEQYSRKDTAQAIMKELNRNEQTLENEKKSNESLQSIKEGLKNITANDFENPTVKKFFKDTQRNFQLGMLPTIVEGSIAIVDGKKSYSIPKETLLKDGKFQTDSFIKHMEKQYEEIAEEFEYNKINDKINSISIDEIQNAYGLKFQTLQNNINHISREITQTFGKAITSEKHFGLIFNLSSRETAIKDQQEWISKSSSLKILPSQIDAYLSRASLTENGRRENRGKALNQFKKVIPLTKKNENEYIINHDNPIHTLFKQRNQEQEYQDLITQATKKFDERVIRFVES